jgi:hypothetical protein
MRCGWRTKRTSKQRRNAENAQAYTFGCFCEFNPWHPAGRLLTRDLTRSEGLATYCACLKNFSPATVIVV